MSYARENGYTPVSFESAMEYVREGVNEQFGCSYTTETFVGSGYYKYFYILVQRVIENENKTADIFAKLSAYITSTNQRISRPSVSLPGLVDAFQSAGYIAAVKNNTIFDVGTVSVCVDVDYTADDYPATKLDIANKLKDFVAAGMVTMGGETSTIVLTNGQSFDFNFYLPFFTDLWIRITIDRSDNSAIPAPSDEAIRSLFLTNFNARYRLGWDFEPERYFTQQDAPWAASILVEHSDDDGLTWSDDVIQLLFYDKVRINLEDISVVIDP